MGTRCEHAATSFVAGTSQGKQQVKAQRLAEAEERLRLSRYASQDEKLQNQCAPMKLLKRNRRPPHQSMRSHSIITSAVDCRKAMREALDRQLQEKAARDGALKRHESDCFPSNHTASPRPADTLRPWSSHCATQRITAQEEVTDVCAEPRGLLHDVCVAGIWLLLI